MPENSQNHSRQLLQAHHRARRELSDTGGGSPPPCRAPAYLAVGSVLDDTVALLEILEVSKEAVGGARVDADGRRVLGRDVRRALLQHRLHQHGEDGGKYEVREGYLERVIKKKASAVFRLLHVQTVDMPDRLRRDGEDGGKVAATSYNPCRRCCPQTLNLTPSYLSRVDRTMEAEAGAEASCLSRWHQHEDNRSGGIGVLVQERATLPCLRRELLMIAVRVWFAERCL